MNTIVWAIRIITDDGTGVPLPISDNTRGILAGEFHLVTGDLSFLNDQDLSGDGINVAFDQYWYKGFTVKDSMSKPRRGVDIVDGGSWGALSGFAFRLNNTNTDSQAFWAWAQAQGIKFVNRRVMLYAFVQEAPGDPWISVQRWTGTVAEDPFTSTDFTVQCSGADPGNTNIYPPEILSHATFPELAASLENKTMPISLGYVEHSLTIPVNSSVNIPVAITFAGVEASTSKPVLTCLAVAYGTPPGGTPYVILFTSNLNFGKDQLASGYSITFVRAGTFTSNIIGNEATTTGMVSDVENYGAAFLTKVYLSEAFDGTAEDPSVTEDNFNDDYEDLNYKGRGIQVFAGVLLPINAAPVGGAVAAPPYVLGQTSRACVKPNSLSPTGSVRGTLGVVYLRGLLLVGETIYWSRDKKFKYELSAAANIFVDGAGGVHGLYNLNSGSRNTDAGQNIYCQVDVIAGQNRLRFFRDAVGTNLIGHTAGYSAIGVQTIVADPNSSPFYFGITGTINITSMRIGTFSIRFDGIANYGQYPSSPGPLAIPIVSISVNPFNSSAFSGVPHGVVSDTTAAFQVAKNSRTLLVSSAGITEYVGPSKLAVYTDGAFENVTQIIGDSSLTSGPTESGAINPYHKPIIVISSKVINATGEHSLLTPIVPTILSVSRYADQVNAHPVFLQSTTSPVPEITDLDRATYATFLGVFPNVGGAPDGVSLGMRVFIDEDLAKKSYQRIFLCFDAAVISDSPFTVLYGALYADPAGVGITGQYFTQLPNARDAYPIGSLQNFLPNEYYPTVAATDGEASSFGLIYRTSTGELFAVNRSFLIPTVLLPQDLFIYGYADLAVFFNNVAVNSTLSVRLKEVGLVGERVINVGTDSLYARIIGEKNDDNTPVTNIYNAFGWFQYQDGVVGTWADVISNLGPIQNQFPIGRQLTDRQTSRQWLTEMARQGFFCVFPDRKGKLNAINWLRRSTEADVTFSDDARNIIAGSISMEQSNYRRLWNTFNFLYNWNPAAGSYDRRLSIQKPDAAVYPPLYESTNAPGDSSKSFAAILVTFVAGLWTAKVFSTDKTFVIGDIFSFYGSDIGASIYFAPVLSASLNGADPTQNVYSFVIDQNFSGSAGIYSAAGTWLKQGSATPAWTNFVSGLNGTQGWQAGKPLWESCHESYLETLSIMEAPPDLTELSWFMDLGKFYETPQVQDFTTFAAYAIANLHVRYTTRQRKIYLYSIPMTLPALRRELLELGSLQDYVFTDNEAKLGWMFDVEDDIQNDCLNIKVMGLPDDVAIDTGDIVETGDGDGDIVEQGDDMDEVVETGDA